jgi:hypothetical protein
MAGAHEPRILVCTCPEGELFSKNVHFGGHSDWGDFIFLEKYPERHKFVEGGTYLDN